MSTRAIVSAAALCGVSLVVVGCRSAPRVPAVEPAFTASRNTQVSTPPFVWVPEWRMYLREGEVVYRAGSYYSYRDGRWYVARSEDGPWTAVATRESRANDQPSREPGGLSPAAPAQTPRSQQQPDSKVSEDERRSRGTSRVVALALAQVGVPYRWGGADPRGFDCSGLVMYVYGRAGVSLPHGAVKQYRLGTPVPRKDLAPGDIVFFDRLNHSGIYIGDGRFVHATKTGDNVKVSRLDDAWFERRWVGARRLPIADRQSLSD